MIGHHLIGQMLDRDRGERDQAGRFPDNRIPANRGNGRVPRPDCDREIEGGDDADRAQRMPLLVHAVGRPFRLHGQSVELAGQADREITDVDHLLDFAVAFGPDLPHLQTDEIAERLLVFPDQAGEVANQQPAFGCRQLSPSLETVHRRLRNPVIGGRGGLDHGSDRLTGCGVVRHELAAVRVADPTLRAQAGTGVHRFELELF